MELSRHHHPEHRNRPGYLEFQLAMFRHYAYRGNHDLEQLLCAYSAY